MAKTIRFKADRTTIRPGECATLRWHVEGVKEVYFFETGQGWQGHGVAGVGERQVCPSRSTSYRLRVVKRNDSVDVRKIKIQVQDQAGSQAVRMFSVDRAEIRPGECATFRWRVQGVQAVYFHPEGRPWQDHGVIGEGEQQVCPSQTATYCLRVVKADGSVDVHRSTVQVRAQAVSQVVQVFSADPPEVRIGDCSTLRWRVQGVKAVYLHPEDQRWQDHGVVGEGEQQVCLNHTTTYCLRVVKVDDSLETHYLTVQIRG
jgi:hypothetical protein